jgi:RND family efflux transporter MFP subunit
MKRLVWLAVLIILTSCGNDEQERPGPDRLRSAKITVATSRLQDVEVREEALGRIVDPAAVTVAAEVPGRVIRVEADEGDAVEKGQILALLDARDLQAEVTAARAEVARIQARVKAQSRLVGRYHRLAREQFVSQTMLDQAEAELAALRKGARAAEARRLQAENNLLRTRVVAPLSGYVQKRYVAAGTYMGVGNPMFQLVTDTSFVVAITIPETEGGRIRVGLPVRLHLPADKRIVHGVITELTPVVGRASNAFEARVDIQNPGNWRPGNSVIAEIILATHKQAVVVPEECLVLRPSGHVVYVIEGDHVRERGVHIGVHSGGYVEILDGLEAGVALAAAGASFLTDGAVVKIQGSMP